MDYGLNSPEHRAVMSCEFDAYAKCVEQEMQAYKPKLEPVYAMVSWGARFEMYQRTLREMHPHASDSVIQAMAFQMTGE